MLNSKIRSRAVVGYGIKIFHPSPPNYVTRSPGVRANERVHIHNVRDFPLARLNSEINARFLLNENGDVYFLLHNSVLVIFLK